MISKNRSPTEGQKSPNNRPDIVYQQDCPTRTLISDRTRNRRKRLGVELQKVSVCADQPKIDVSKECPTMNLAAGKKQKKDTNSKVLGFKYKKGIHPEYFAPSVLKCNTAKTGRSAKV